jgi:hypothetical protein
MVLWAKLKKKLCCWQLRFAFPVACVIFNHSSLRIVHFRCMPQTKTVMHVCETWLKVTQCEPPVQNVYWLHVIFDIQVVSTDYCFVSRILITTYFAATWRAYILAVKHAQFFLSLSRRFRNFTAWMMTMSGCTWMWIRKMLNLFSSKYLTWSHTDNRCVKFLSTW